MHLTTAPTYFHFPSAGKRKAEDKYDIARYFIQNDVEIHIMIYIFRFGYTAEPLGKWITERTGVAVSMNGSSAAPV